MKDKFYLFSIIICKLIAYLPADGQTLQVIANPPQHDVCTAQNSTFIVVNPNPNHTYEWYVEDYSSWVFGAGLQEVLIGTGPVINIFAPAMASYGCTVFTVHELDQNQNLVGWGEYYFGSYGSQPIPTYVNQQQCNEIEIPFSFDSVHVQGRSAQWYLNGLPSGVTGMSIHHPGVGTYQYRLTLACGVILYSDSVNITYQTPVPVVSVNGPSSVCQGDTILLQTSTNGNFYQWYRNNIQISGGNSAFYKATLPGFYAVSYYQFGCLLISDSVTLGFQTSPIANITTNGSTTFCYGSPVTLTADSMPGYTFHWKKNGTNISGATKRSYKVSLTGNYSVAITNSCGSTVSAVISCTRIANPLPVVTYIGNLIFCPPQTLTFNANTFPGVTYQWQRNGVTINGAISQSYIATIAGGSYRVRETANGCSLVSKIWKTTNNCRFNESIGQKNVSLTIQPNPFSNSTTIILPEETDLTNCEIIVYDIFGNEVRKTKPDDYRIEFNKEDLETGIYIVKLLSGYQTLTSLKMIIMR